MRETFDSDQLLRLAMIGDLDVAKCNQVKDRLRSLENPGYAVLIDLSLLRFIDSTGVRALVLGIENARRRGCQVQVDRQLARAVELVVEVMGITSCLWPGEGSNPTAAESWLDG